MLILLQNLKSTNYHLHFFLLMRYFIDKSFRETVNIVKKTNLIIALITILISILLFHLNSWHYKLLAHDQITKVIDMQEADIHLAKVTYDQYDYFEAGYVMEVYFNDDPEIKYRYVYERDKRRVHISAWLKNASLDLTNQIGKYDYFKTVKFDRNREIQDVIKR